MNVKGEKRQLRICSRGHRYYKTTDCPVCPVCENARKPKDGFLALLSAPARRALENADIRTLEALSAYREQDILSLHGMGKASMPILREALGNAGLNFQGSSQ